MNIYRRKLLWKALLLLFAIVIGLGSLFYTQALVAKLKTEEKKKAEHWAEATRRLIEVSGDSEDFDFLFSIVENNNTVPVILIDDHDNILSHRNLPQSISTDTIALNRELKRMGERNEPIIINLSDGISNYIYYRESTLLRQLRVYPYIQLAVILLFIAAAYVAFSTSRIAEQNQVWLGLSRETAHQLGTPTSSLSAWVEIFKSRYPDSDIIADLSADVRRLRNVAERFSLIGSKPKMYAVYLPALLETTAEYIRKRVASTIEINVIFEIKSNCEVPANAILIGWVIENLVKNAADAMKGTGTINIRITETGQEAIVDIEDAGKGIPKKDFKTIFKPGYTTRESGWGLGLSLSKRIIEEYHKGKIYVRHSEPGKGTCMRVVLKKF